MGLVRWSPWQGLLDVERDMDQLTRRMFGSSGVWGGPGNGRWVPAVDVFTRDQDLVIRAELPGIDPEKDLDISLQEGMLTIRGERRLEHRDEGDGTYRVESAYGSFSRSVMLPEGVKEKDIEASYDRGILEVVVPKAAAVPSPKKIPVKAGGGRKALDAKGRRAG